MDDDLAHELHVLRPRKGDVLIVTAEPDRWASIELTLNQLGHRALFLAPGETVAVSR